MTTPTIAAKSSKRGKQVSTQHVNSLISNYKTQRWAPNSERMGKVDSLSTWYGLEELSAFLELARNNQADGIKMYYGVYADDYAEVPDFQGRQTVVLVATKQKVTETGLVNKDIYINKNGRSEVLAFNVGQVCPPWCGTGLPPDIDGPFGIDMEKTGITIVDRGDRLIII